MGNSGAQFLVVGDCVRAIPLLKNKINPRDTSPVETLIRLFDVVSPGDRHCDLMDGHFPYHMTEYYLEPSIYTGDE